MSTYTPPDNPTDAEAAALDLIVQFPAVALAQPGRLLHPLIEALQDYAGMLSAAEVFTGMPWPDAKQVAAAIAFDVCMRDDAGQFLRQRAANALGGGDGMVWRDREQVARAMTVAAAALGDGGAR